MRKISVVLATLATVLVAAPAFAETFVAGPATVRHPAAGPSVGYDPLQVERRMDSVEAQAPQAAADASQPLRPWLESWYQASERPGV